MATKTAPQISMEDEWLEDTKLEELLEGREEAKSGKTAYVEADKAAKEHIKALNFDGVKRCGRFLITVKATEVTSVSFDRGGGRRVSIKNAEAKGE